MHLNDISNDVIVENMTKAFLDMLNKHAPIKSKTIRHQNQPALFTKDIKEAILERDRSKKRHKFNEYRNHRNKVVKMIKNAKSKHYHRALSEINGNSKKLWKEMHELSGKKSKASPMSLMIDNEICNDQNILVNELNKYFTHVAEEIMNEHSEVLPANSINHLWPYITLLIINYHMVSLLIFLKWMRPKALVTCYFSLSLLV